MKIVLASSEAVPFSKTGGLADVASALPKALSRAGHEVWLITPHYPRLSKHAGPSIVCQEQMVVPVGRRKVIGSLRQAQLPDSGVNVVLVEQPTFFDRDAIYQLNGKDYGDNCERFVFFSRAVMEAIRLLDIQPDIIHAHDWQTGLVPALLRIEYRRRSGFDSAASVFTIHNLAFQGQFWHWDMLLTGLDWKYFNWRQMEFYDHLNLMKTGIAFADLITTVSPTYAREIQTEEMGYGLQGAIAHRRSDLVGILNGVDTDDWNPKSDRALPVNYSADDFAVGKAACKTALQQKVNLPVRSEPLLYGMISRMTDQKGFDLIRDGADEILRHDVQLCFLGTGSHVYEEFLRDLARRWPEKVAVTIGFDDALAHQIEAGADAYPMPSRFEPCGLNQMYSMIYGTVPVVRSVGGLADSVVDLNPHTKAAGTATGFSFRDYTVPALLETLARSRAAFQDPQTWRSLVQSGMRRDWSWGRSANEYLSVYQRAAGMRAAAATLSTAR